MGDGTGAGTARGAAIRGLIAHATERAGASPMGEVISLAMAAGGGHGVLLGEPLIGYAHLVQNPDGAGWMVEAALIDPADADRMAGAIADAATELGVEQLTWWTHDAGIHVRDARFEVERELHRMRVRLPVGSPHWPDGFVVRSFRPGTDEQALLAVNNRAFAGHPEQAGWTLETMALRTTAEWFDRDGLRMVWQGERLVAFNWTKRHPDHVGEIYVTAVDPSHQGRGLGRATVIEGLRDLHERQGATEAVLYVDAAESAAVNLYRSLGFRSEHISRAYRAVLSQP